MTGWNYVRLVNKPNVLCGIIVPVLIHSKSLYGYKIKFKVFFDYKISFTDLLCIPEREKLLTIKK